LAIVAVLAVGDCLLWNWSLAANQDTVALLSGLALPFLAVVLVRLMVRHLARLGIRFVRLRRISASSRWRAGFGGRKLPRASPAASGETGVATSTQSEKIAA
jgi:hypothetical protein